LTNRQSSAAMTYEQPTRDPRPGDADSAGGTPRDAAEAKRLEARRRFLLGGATAASVLVTVSRARAFSFSECAQNAEARGFNQATELMTRLGIDGSDPAGPLCQIFLQK
jgi:hypothetical protein